MASLMGFLSEKLSLLGLTTAAMLSDVRSPFLWGGKAEDMMGGGGANICMGRREKEVLESGKKE